MPSEQEPMGDIEMLVEQSLQYQGIIYEYWALASQQTLTQQQAARIEEILGKAELDTWLDFLIDEVDYLLAAQLGLIRKQVIHHQIQELKKSIDRFWCEKFLSEIQKQNRSMEVQRYLRDQGLYDGLIDGYIGLRTRKALEVYKQGVPINWEKTNCFNLQAR